MVDVAPPLRPKRRQTILLTLILLVSLTSACLFLFFRERPLSEEEYRRLAETKVISTTVDVYDMCWRHGPLTEAMINDFMGNWADAGINRVYWRLSVIGHNLYYTDVDTRFHSGFGRGPATVYLWDGFKSWQGDHTNRANIPLLRLERNNAIAIDAGLRQVPILEYGYVDEDTDPYHSKLTWNTGKFAFDRSLRSIGADLGEKRSVGKIEIIGGTGGPCRLRKHQLEIYYSHDQKDYIKYQGSWNYRNYKNDNGKRVLSLNGLSISARYIKVHHTLSDTAPTLSNELTSMIKVYQLPTITRIKIIKKDSASTTLHEGDLEIYHSNDNMRYTRYEGSLVFKDAIENGLRILTLDGLNITARVIKVRSTAKNTDFQNFPYNMIKAFSHDAELEGKAGWKTPDNTPTSNLGDAAMQETMANFDTLRVAASCAKGHGLEFYAWITLFDEVSYISWRCRADEEHANYALIDNFGEYPMASQYALDNWELQDCDRTQSYYAEGNLCYAHEKNREQKLNMVRELVRYENVDGVALSIRSHTRYGRNPFTGDQVSLVEGHANEFGFNQPIVEEFQRRYGVNMLTTDLTPAQERDRQKLRGEYLTKLLEEMKAATSVEEKRLEMMVPSSLTVTEGSGAGLVGVHDPTDYIGNMNFDWQNWFTQEKVDGLIVIGAGNHPSWKSDGWGPEIERFAKGHNKTVIIHCNFNEATNPEELNRFIKECLKSPFCGGVELYEAVELNNQFLLTIRSIAKP